MFIMKKIKPNHTFVQELHRKYYLPHYFLWQSINTPGKEYLENILEI